MWHLFQSLLLILVQSICTISTFAYTLLWDLHWLINAGNHPLPCKANADRESIVWYFSMSWIFIRIKKNVNTLEPETGAPPSPACILEWESVKLCSFSSICWLRLAEQLRPHMSTPSSLPTFYHRLFLFHCPALLPGWGLCGLYWSTS